MPKKKKTQINGFYLFMLDVRPQLEREGRCFPNGLKDVVDVAHPRWKLLSPEARKRYDDMAKAEKRRQNATQEGKLTSDGRLISDVKKIDCQERNILKNMISSVKNWIQNMPSKEDAANEKFYFISFNIVCQVLVDGYDDEVIYIPNEVGIIEYSIADGIIRHYHKFIAPGALPMGYAFAAKQHSDDTHKIPTLGFELADDNYTGIWIQMKNFINQDEMKETYPPVFTSCDQMKQTKGCIDWLHERANDRRKRLFRVYDINYLLLELRFKADQPLAALSEAKDLLSKHTFNYTHNICCQWHEEEDCTDCSLGAVKRLGFLMSDALCHFYEVDITVNHLPEQLDTYQSINIQSSSAARGASRPTSQARSSGFRSEGGSQMYAGASGYSQDFGSASQGYSQYSDFSSSTVNDLSDGFSQTTIEDGICNDDNADSSQDTDGGWISVGRGSTRRTGSSNNLPPRRPGQVGSSRPGLGRGILGRQHK